MTDNNDAKACELIQDYIGPDHKAIDMQAFYSAGIVRVNWLEPPGEDT